MSASSSRRALFGAALTGEEATVVPHRPSPQLLPPTPHQDKGKQRANNTSTPAAAVPQSNSDAGSKGPRQNQPRKAKQLVQRQPAAAAALTAEVVPGPADDDDVRSLPLLADTGEGSVAHLHSCREMTTIASFVPKKWYFSR